MISSESRSISPRASSAGAAAPAVSPRTNRVRVMERGEGNGGAGLAASGAGMTEPVLPVADVAAVEAAEDRDAESQVQVPHAHESLLEVGMDADPVHVPPEIV